MIPAQLEKFIMDDIRDDYYSFIQVVFLAAWICFFKKPQKFHDAAVFFDYPSVVLIAGDTTPAFILYSHNHGIYRLI
jgi:hypothetical protein